MKKITYTMKLLSSLIISPRAGQALYKDVDKFCVSADVKHANKDKNQPIAVVYPFYQYGEYEKYDPENTEYYLPGSSIKGAFLQNNEAARHCMADDVVVPFKFIFLENLWKAQFLEDENIQKAKFDYFFENVGIEMIKSDTTLNGEFYLEDTIQFSDMLQVANEDTKNKINQMREYLQTLQKREYTEAFKTNLKEIESKLSSLLNENNVILLGGYKGLLHSMILNKTAETQGGLFIDPETMLPHGLVRIIE